MVGFKWTASWQGLLVFLMLLLLLSFALPPAHASVRLSTTHIKLGEPVILMIAGKDIETDFEKVNKPAIRKHFEIYDVTGESDRMRLVLYPRKVGTWSLPAMHQGNIQSPAIAVQVDENPQVKIEWQGPPKTAYFHQLVTWTAKVTLSNSANTSTMLVHPHALSQVIHTVPSQSTAEKTGLFGKTQYWVMGESSQKLGNMRLRSPVISVKNEGQRPWLFFDEIHWVKVQPLPSYLPRNTPVGQVTLKQDASVPWLMETGQLHHWHLTLNGQNMLPENLPNLMGQLNTSDAIEWLTPEQKKHILWQKTALLGQLKLSIPYRINHAGFYQLPSIRLTYLDPTTDTLKDVFLPSQMGMVLPSWLVLILKIIAWIWVLGIVFLLWRVGRLVWIKQRLIHALKKVEDETTLWLLIETAQCKMLNQTHPAGFSLGQWQQQLEDLNVSQETLQLTQQLNQMFYQQNKGMQPNNPAWKTLHKTAQAWANSVSIYALVLNELRMAQNFFRAMLRA